MIYDWDPELKRCPKSLLTPDVLDRISWWDEWRRYGVLPYGNATLSQEPAFVFDVIDVCQRTFEQAFAELQQREK